MGPFARIGIAALMMAPGTALAWEASSEVPFQSGPGLRDVAVGLWGRSAVVLTLSDSELSWFDARTGQRTGRQAVGGRALALQDLDGNGTNELLVCGPSGITLWRGGPEAPQSTLQVVTEPCEDLGTMTVDGVAAVVRSTRGQVWVHRPKPGQGLIAEPLGDSIGSDARIVSGLRGFAAYSLDGAAVYAMNDWGKSIYGAGGQVRAVGAGPDGWAWLVDGGSALHDASGHRTVLPEPATGLSSIAADRDATPDLVVTFPGSKKLGILSSGNASLVTMPTSRAPELVASGDVDADGCGDLALVEVSSGSGVFLKGKCAAQLAGWSALTGWDGKAAQAPAPAPAPVAAVVAVAAPAPLAPAPEVAPAPLAVAQPVPAAPQPDPAVAALPVDGWGAAEPAPAPSGKAASDAAAPVEPVAPAPAPAPVVTGYTKEIVVSRNLGTVTVPVGIPLKMLLTDSRGPAAGWRLEGLPDQLSVDDGGNLIGTLPQAGEWRGELIAVDGRGPRAARPIVIKAVNAQPRRGR